MSLPNASPTLAEDRQSWYVVAGLIWLSILGSFIANVQPVFLGVLSEVFALNAQQLGLAGGIELGGAGLASLGAVYWFPRFELRKIALFAITMLVVSNLITTWVSSYSLLLLVRFCAGFFGSGIVYAMALGLIGQMPNTERVIAIAIICHVISLVLGMAIIPVLFEYWFFQGVSLSISLLFATGLLFLPLIPERANQAQASSDQSASAIGVVFLPCALLGSLLLFSIGLGGVWAFLERIGNSAGFSMVDIGNALALAGLMGGAGALVAAIVSLRFGRLLPLVISIGGQLGVCLLFASRNDWLSYLIAIALFNFFWNLALPYLMGAIASADKTGRFMVLIPAAQAGGYAIGPVLAGSFIVGDAYATAGFVSMAVFACCLIFVVPLIRRLS